MTILRGSPRRFARTARIGARRRTVAIFFPARVAETLAVVLISQAIAATPAGAIDVTARIIDLAGSAVPDAVVFLPEMPGVASTPPKTPYVLDQIDKMFVPRILPIVVGGEVRFPNRDNIHHHVYSFSRPRKFEIQLYKGEPTGPIRFDQLGAVKVGCNIHNWMSAVILVLPNPHFAVTGENGEATLRNLPSVAGLTLQVFHERLKDPVESTAQSVPLGSPGAGPMTWTIELKPERARERPAFGY